MTTQKPLNLMFFSPKDSENPGALFVDTGISAGFPSPADDFKEQRLSLDDELIKNKEATFFAESIWPIHDRCWTRRQRSFSD